MNYDTILLELLFRIQTLEEQAADLTRRLRSGNTLPAQTPPEPSIPEPAHRRNPSTREIQRYIEERKPAATENNESLIILQAGDIHRTCI